MTKSPRIEPHARRAVVSVRVAGWLTAVVVAIASGTMVPESLFPGARPVVLGVTLIGIGLAGELIHTDRERRRSRSGAEARDSRAADGRIDVATLAGACRVINPIDPRFGAFRAWLRTPVAESRPLHQESPPLLGRTAIVSLFVGRDGQPWSETEIAETHEAMARAGRWIEQEAMRYRVNVNIELADTYFVFDEDRDDEIVIEFGPGGDLEGPFEGDGTTKALVMATRAALAAGFRDVEDLIKTAYACVDADEIVLLMHPRREGRSFAIPVELSMVPGVSLAVCYAGESSFPERLRATARTDPVTIVHEMLHLFGASDKYGSPLSKFAPKTVTAREVMRLNETRLSRLRIDPRTAAEIGWREKTTADGN